MRNLFLKAAVTANVFILSSSPALAQYWGGGSGWGSGGGWSGWGSGGGGGWSGWGGSGGGGGWSGGDVAPEIDASSGMLASVALTAILLFVLERRNQAKAVKAEATE